ncbi:NepR family anti-sigma factor [Sphingomonas bacterium]|nr:NepR family anti-sigma factor [Sphingomonas bacterium]
MPKPAKNVTKRADEPQMGLALRSVYQRTVEEAVPDEMLDLLSKLD